MYTKKLPTAACAAGILLTLVAGRAALSQHVHGVMELGIVVEDGALAVSLSAPLSDVVGFEHAAENDAQTERLRDAAALLSDADAMFAVPDQAGCTLEELTLDAPSYLLALRDGTHAAEESHGDHEDHSGDAAHSGHDDHHDEHDDEHDHDDHADHDSEHAEVDARYVWACSDSGELRTLGTPFVKGFASVETINVQIITPTATRVVEADQSLETIDLSGG